jgi:hypothetical protein
MSEHYKSESEIQAVIHGFEACSTAAADFTHCAHLTVAAWYLTDDSVGGALQKMRASIFRFVDHHQVGRAKYNETITLFWLKAVESFLQRSGRGQPLLQRVNGLIEALGDSRLVFEYYSRELLWSEEAKRGWVEPDLKPLDF